MNEQRLTLPWPPKILGPNQRAHWAERSRAAKKYRAECALLSRGRLQLPESGQIALRLEFHPPDGRIRDDDNMLASFKAGRDGVADGLGIDDRRFSVRSMRVCEKRPGGAVVLIVEGAS